MTAKVIPMQRPRMFCWQCGKVLNYQDGRPIFEVVSLPGGNQVKVHKACKQGAIDSQTFDGTPVSGRTHKLGSLEAEKHADWIKRRSVEEIE